LQLGSRQRLRNIGGIIERQGSLLGIDSTPSPFAWPRRINDRAIALLFDAQNDWRPFAPTDSHCHG
jgi:hypothetical protein